MTDYIKQALDSINKSEDDALWEGYPVHMREKANFQIQAALQMS